MREERLQERVREIRPELSKARELVEKAASESRELTAEEQKVYDEIMAEGRSVADAVKQHRHDEEVYAFARELADEVGVPLSHDDLSSSGSGSKSRRLSFTAMGAKVAARTMPDGTKALAPSGATVVGQEFVQDPVALVRSRNRSWTCCRSSSTPRPSTPTCASRCGRTTRPWWAAGAVKPTSVYTVNKVPNTLAVVALLSRHLCSGCWPRTARRPPGRCCSAPSWMRSAASDE